MKFSGKLSHPASLSLQESQEQSPIAQALFSMFFPEQENQKASTTMVRGLTNITTVVKGVACSDISLVATFLSC